MDSKYLSPMSQPRSILVATDLNDLDFLLPVAIEQGRMTGAIRRIDSQSGRNALQ
jgi:hypothetical protein